LGGRLSEIYENDAQILVSNLCADDERCWLGGDQSGWIFGGDYLNYDVNNFGVKANIDDSK
jgi:hypothetical protein